MIDNTRISGTQFMFTAACFIQASVLLSTFFLKVTLQDSWMMIITGFLAALPIMLVFGSLMKTYPKNNLIEINDIVFGKVLGKFFSAFYIYFFINLTTLNLNDLGQFVQKTIMRNTPKFAIIVTFVIVCIWAIRYGLDVVTRHNFLFCIVSLTVAIIALMLIFNEIDLNNFLPMFDQPPIKYVQSTHILATIPFGELVIMVMITPSIDIKPKKFTKFMILGVLIGLLNMLIVIARDTGVLGNAAILFTMPSFETLRLISIGQALSRMEILFATVLIILLFSKITLLYYVTVKALSSVFKLKSYKPLVLSLGVLMTVYTFFIYTQGTAHDTLGSKVTPFVWLLFEYILPLITFVVMKIKIRMFGKPVSPEVNNSTSDTAGCEGESTALATSKTAPQEN